jgi:DNA repair exonuclease SbcCD ATPase subunit
MILKSIINFIENKQLENRQKEAKKLKLHEEIDNLDVDIKLKETLIKKRLKEFFDNKRLKELEIKIDIYDELKDKFETIEIAKLLNNIKNLDCKNDDKIEKIKNSLKVIEDSRNIDNLLEDIAKLEKMKKNLERLEKEKEKLDKNIIPKFKGCISKFCLFCEIINDRKN